MPAFGVRADIYGYVDDRGIPHLAGEPLDGRYKLFKKEPGPALKTIEPEGGEIDGPGRVRVNAAERKRYTPLIAAVARELRVDSALLHAVIAVESGYNARARSPRGAMGLMQLMPETARRYEVEDIWNPRDNLRGGARYLRDLLAQYGQDLTLTLAAYNAGAAAVTRHGNTVPPYPETLDYVPRVLGMYRMLMRASPAEPGEPAGATR